MDLNPLPPGAPDCPKCDAQLVEGLGAGRRTMMGVSRGYDDDGVQHRHDPNWTKTDYKCENGHRVRISQQKSCPAQNCDYGGEKRVNIIE